MGRGTTIQDGAEAEPEGHETGVGWRALATTGKLKT